MTTSIDTNAIAALWNVQDQFNQIALNLIEQTGSQSELVIAGPVYAELMAGPLRSEEALDRFLLDTSIAVDWVLGEVIWREAGRVYRDYTQRRHRSDKTHPRRILTDFLIGAHASIRGYALLTLDRRLYAAAFPRLKIITD